MSNQKIHQIQVAYSRLEDRLLLRFNTTDGMEFRFWLTRLFVKKFWAGLVDTLETSLVALPSQDPMIKQSVMGFMHEAAVGKANFKDPFQSETVSSFPFGPEPVLISRARIQPKGGGLHLLSLFPEKGDGVELGVDQNLLHLLGKMIRDAIIPAEWGLMIQMPGSDLMAALMSDVDGEKNRRVH